MSDRETDTFKQLIEASFDQSTDVVRTYIDTKIIQKDFDGDFNKFLELQKHEFFLQWNPRKKCCCPQSNSPRNYLIFDDSIYQKLYTINHAVQCSYMEQRNGITKCFCQVVPIRDVPLKSLDIGALTCIMIHYGKIDVVPMGYIKKLREIRNQLCHVPGTTMLTMKDFETMWETLETAMYRLADEISPCLKSLISPSIKTIKNKLGQIISTESDKQITKDDLKNLKESSKHDLEVIKETITKKSSDMENQLTKVASIGTKSASTITAVSSHLDTIDERLDKIEKLIVVGQQTRKRLPNHRCTVRSRMSVKTSNKSTTNKPIPKTCKKRVTAVIKSEILDETKVIENIAKKEEETKSNRNNLHNVDSKAFKIDKIEKHCIQFDLRASTDVFDNAENLQSAIDGFIDRLLEAGEVDLCQPGTIEIEITVHSPLTEDEMMVVQSVFCQSIDLSDLSSNTNRENMTVGDEFEQNPKVKTEMTLPSTRKRLHAGKSRDEPIEIMSSELDNPIIIQAEKLKFTVQIVDIPKFLEKFEETFDTTSQEKRKNNLYVQWSWKCPKTWRVSNIAHIMNRRIMNIKEWFKPDFAFNDRFTGQLILQTHTQYELFSSYLQFEGAVKTFIEKICEVCELQNDEDEQVNIGMLVKEKERTCKIEEVEEEDDEEEEEGIILDDTTSKDPKRAKMDTDAKQTPSEKTELDACKHALMSLGAYSCLDIQRAADKAQLNRIKRLFFPNSEQKLKIAYLENRKSSIPKIKPARKKELFSHICSQKVLLSTDFPDLDYLDDNCDLRCIHCSTTDIIGWCKGCCKLFCPIGLTEHNDIKNIKIKSEFLDTAVTLRKKYVNTNAVNLLGAVRVFDFKLLTKNVIIILLRNCDGKLHLLVWKSSMKIYQIQIEKSRSGQIAIINAAKYAIRTESAVSIVDISNTIASTNIFQEDSHTGSTGIEHVKGFLYVVCDSGILKMTLEGDKLGSIDVKGIDKLHSLGMFIYCTSAEEHKHVTVINTIDDSTRILTDFPVQPDQLNVTYHGIIAFTHNKCLWCTSDEGQSFKLLMSFEDDLSLISSMIRVSPFTGELFVTLDFGLSIVLNIYLVAWPEGNRLSHINTDHEGDANYVRQKIKPPSSGILKYDVPSTDTTLMTSRTHSDESKKLTDFPDLDYHDDNYDVRCSHCSTTNIIGWCKSCCKLFCPVGLNEHNDIKNFEIKSRFLDSAVTLRQTYTNTCTSIYYISVLDFKFLTKNILLVLTQERFGKLHLLVWKYTESTTTKHQIQAQNSPSVQIAIINAAQCAIRTKHAVSIVDISEPIASTNIFQDDSYTGSTGIEHVNGLLYVALGSNILKMTLRGVKLGSIDLKGIDKLHSVGEYIYCTSAEEHNHVTVINTINDSTRILNNFPVEPDQLDVTDHGIIVFTHNNCVWCTSDEGQNFKLLMSSDGEDIYKSQMICARSFTGDMFVMQATRNYPYFEVSRYVVAWPESNRPSNVTKYHEGNANYVQHIIQSPSSGIMTHVNPSSDTSLMMRRTILDESQPVPSIMMPPILHSSSQPVFSTADVNPYNLMSNQPQSRLDAGEGLPLYVPENIQSTLSYNTQGAVSSTDSSPYSLTRDQTQSGFFSLGETFLPENKQQPSTPSIVPPFPSTSEAYPGGFLGDRAHRELVSADERINPDEEELTDESMIDSALGPSSTDFME